MKKIEDLVTVSLTIKLFLLKFFAACEQKNPTMNSFLSGLESSGWLKHIKSILDTSWFIAQAVEDGTNVIVHCSDGWDRTAQVCSLASLLLDPYYRSIKGFQALIEKDWLAFGHKFSERCGHVQNDSKEYSPVFTQLLDATWQLTQQFPLTFQFNERFLLTIHDHMYYRLAERTFSLWGYMAYHMSEYVNPVYIEEETPGILVPNLCPQNISIKIKVAILEKPAALEDKDDPDLIHSQNLGHTSTTFTKNPEAADRSARIFKEN
ncbi:hypothetical protein FQA39_LY18767 [Lamprigera yunnana]|nr:hypothetical protein FQA39_LY18767 [Lamprigera yunnana]